MPTAEVTMKVMPRRSVVLAALVVADAVAFALTIHTHLTYRSGGAGGAPTVMTLGEMLGWIISVSLLLVLGGLMWARLGKWRQRRRRARLAAALAGAAASSSGQLGVQWSPGTDHSRPK
jgi:heme/copper-type cytochrome/quinol oxidase subunit 3